MQDEFGNESPAPSGERVGFCQDCGKPLTQETVRTVGSGVFCEPCLEARVGAAGQAAYTAPPAGAGPVAGGSYGAAVPLSSTHQPSPVLAGFLGLIPGVGAMYNGQFAKGIAHLIIFMVLTSLSDHVSGVFGLLCAGWVFYQAFEAYHTARARLEGLPLPNAFGLNDIGERMGFGKNWPGSASRPPVYPPVTPWTPGTPPATAPVPPVPPANWAGYVPPSAFATAQTPVPPFDPVAQAAHAASWTSSPYQAPYTAPYTPVAAAPVVPPVVPTVPSRRFPIGALWLIGLGVLFSLANLDTNFHMSGLWLSAVILAGLAIWMMVHRLLHVCNNNGEGFTAEAVLSCVVRWPPVVLLVLSVLFALQAADIYTLGQTWPVIIITFGVMLLLERALVRPVYGMPAATVPPTAASWAPEVAVAQPPVHTGDDTTKDGQE